MDSFIRWISKELGDVDVIADANESFTHSSSTATGKKLRVRIGPMVTSLGGTWMDML